MKTTTQTAIEFRKASGICLLLSSILATAIMALHPSGGNIEYIVKVKHVLIFSHSMAILCLPFIGFGFWGLSDLLQTKSKLSSLAFCILCFGLIAAMIAAAINGLVLPNFASQNLIAENYISEVSTIIGYGHAINISMTNIFITSIAFAIGIWSFLIILTNNIPRWVGYFGLIMIVSGLFGVLLKFNFTNLLGFRAFTFGLVIWILVVGFNMVRKQKVEMNTSL